MSKPKRGWLSLCWRAGIFIMETKICKDCKLKKPLNEFYKDKITPDGHTYRCKPCNNFKVKTYKLKNPEKSYQYQKNQIARKPDFYKQKSKEYYINNKDRIKAYRKQYVLKNPRKQKEIDLRPYGLTLNDFDNMLLIQKNKCPICIRPFTEKRKPYVDHCHLIGKVRGLLCNRCNLMLGVIKEEISFLNRMIKYIKKSNPLQYKLEL